MSALFSIVSVPFGIVMKYIYTLVGSYGLSILIFSLLAKIITLPLTVKQKRSMIKMQALQPKMQELQRKYGKDQQRYSEELKNFYAQEGVSPMGGCGTALLTLPIMIGLYGVISEPLTYFMRVTREQITAIAERLSYTITGQGTQIGLAGEIFKHFDRVADLAPNLMRVDFSFLGFNLAATPSFKEPSMLWIIPIVSGLSALAMSWVQQWLTKSNTPKDAQKNDQMAKTNMMMMLMMPAMSLYFGFILPAGLSLYWISNSIFAILQDIILNAYLKRAPRKGEPN